MRCYCGFLKSFSECCQMVLENQNATTAEILMRSRYSAYILKKIDYLYETTFPLKRVGNLKQDIKSWANEVEFIKLEILNSTYDTVEFIAHFNQNKQLQKHHEISRFKQLNQQWFYYDYV